MRQFVREHIDQLVIVELMFNSVRYDDSRPPEPNDQWRGAMPTPEAAPAFEPGLASPHNMAFNSRSWVTATHVRPKRQTNSAPRDTFHTFTKIPINHNHAVKLAIPLHDSCQGVESDC
jgi:hypothetical protein